jgi:hypothetical protein
MCKNNFSTSFIAAACAAILLFISACSINVKKEPNGQDKQVDINTLAGNIHVSKQADLADVGLAVYPGARPKERYSGDDKSANVNISGFGYGIKVVALEFESADSSAKILSFYRDQLKRYGKVLECHTSNFDLDLRMNTATVGASGDLTCEGPSGRHIELKAGTKDDQHIVAVDPDGSGSNFSLVYVRTHGKDSDI